MFLSLLRMITITINITREWGKGQENHHRLLSEIKVTMLMTITTLVTETKETTLATTNTKPERPKTSRTEFGQQMRSLANCPHTCL